MIDPFQCRSFMDFNAKVMFLRSLYSFIVSEVSNLCVLRQIMRAVPFNDKIVVVKNEMI